MRIAFTAQHHREIGGLEIYLKRLFAQFRDLGVQVALLHEFDEPADRGPITYAGMPRWCVAEVGAERAVEGMAQWQPDLVLGYGLHDPALERRTLRVAPAVFFGGHGYHGVCISGTKTHAFPETRPCHRRFGAACLVHYLPRRCGGRSPLTMIGEYRRQSERLRILRDYATIVTNGEQAAGEYARYGFTPRIATYVDERIRAASEIEGDNTTALASGDREGPWRLLFLGRMQAVKGGKLLLESLPEVVRRLDCPIDLRLVGDGPDRAAWQEQAARIEAATPGLRIRFEPWRASAELDLVWRESDLLVVPSLWAEPFATVGQEARAFGVPVVAFAVGGNVDWLLEGVNGHVAPGDPPREEGLTAAIVRALSDPQHHRELSHRSVRMSHWFTFERHAHSLLEICEEVSAGGPRGSGPVAPLAGGVPRTGTESP